MNYPPIVILCGGKGKRLGLKNTPKPMVDLCGYPLLRWQIETFKVFGFRRFILITGHLSSVIENYFGDGKKFGVSIEYIIEAEPKGTVFALYSAKNLLQDKSFFLAYGDVLSNINPNSLLEFKSQNTEITNIACVHPNSHPEDSDLIQLGANNLIINSLKKGSFKSGYTENLVNAAFYFFESLPEYPYELEKKDIGMDLVQHLVEEKNIYGFKTTAILRDLGTPERLNKGAGLVKDKNFDEWANRKNSAWILDRDDTIIKDPWSTTLDKPSLINGSGEAIKKINQSNNLAICITNQPGVAKGFFNLNQVLDTNKFIQGELANYNAFIDEWYICPHHPERGFAGEIKELKKKCSCRKPGALLFKKAIKDSQLDVQKSFCVGDHVRDIIPGNMLGFTTIYLGKKESFLSQMNHLKLQAEQPDYYFDSLLDAVKVLLA
jgi:mannose-1-phosphate guanylyltransferase/phosphomannomutase